MGELIDDLLEFSRLGRANVSMHTVDMNDLVHHTLEKLNSEKKDREVELLIENLPHASGDFKLLQQVWINLLSNAFKYSRKKSRAVIQIGSFRQEKETVYFVKDNGAGFDMRYAHKLFGVFQRLHLAEEYDGTGVGLALVQRIIQKHGGRIWAEGKVDEGATFYFALQELESE